MLSLWCNSSEKSSFSQILLKWNLLLLVSFFSCDPLSVDLVRAGQQVNFHFLAWTSKDNLQSITGFDSIQKGQFFSKLISYPNKIFLAGSNNQKEAVLAIGGQGLYFFHSYDLENLFAVKDPLLDYLFQSRELKEVFFYRDFFYLVFNKSFSDNSYRTGTRIVQFSPLERSSQLITYSFQTKHPNFSIQRILPFKDSWLIEWISEDKRLFTKEIPPFSQNESMQNLSKISFDQSSLNKQRFLNFIQQSERKDEVLIFIKDSQGFYENSLENELKMPFFEAMQDSYTLTVLTHKNLYSMNKLGKIKETFLPVFDQGLFEYHNMILTLQGYLILWTRSESEKKFRFGILLIPYTK